MTIFFLLFLGGKGGGRVDDVVRYRLVCCWRFKQKSEAGCFLVCCWILFYVQYTWCTFIHIHSFFQVNNIIRTFHEYRNKVFCSWKKCYKNSGLNNTPKIVDVKKKGGVITHKNVFVPRHVLFLGLMYFFYWFIETWSTKNAHLHVLLILTV